MLVGGEQGNVPGNEIDPVVNERDEPIHGSESQDGEEQGEKDRLFAPDRRRRHDRRGQSDAEPRGPGRGEQDAQGGEQQKSRRGAALPRAEVPWRENSRKDAAV